MAARLHSAAESEPMLWRGMTRARLDAAYNNTAAVPRSAAFLDDWTRRSAVLRKSHPDLIDLRYGPRERNRIDLFRGGRPDAPLLVFIHGGYWQRNAKEMFSCMAEGLIRHGIDVAVVGYTLAPEATVTGIVAEIAAVLRWLRREGPVFGVAKDRVIVSGWSAGGHLTAAAMHCREVNAGLCISGIFDLEPCRLNYLNEKLRLTAEEAASMSPLLHMPAGAGPLVVAYGLGELPELQRQSSDYAASWLKRGLRGAVLPLPGHDHFSILEELASANGRLCETVRQLAAM